MNAATMILNMLDYAIFTKADSLYYSNTVDRDIFASKIFHL